MNSHASPRSRRRPSKCRYNFFCGLFKNREKHYDAIPESKQVLDILTRIKESVQKNAELLVELQNKMQILELNYKIRDVPLQPNHYEVMRPIQIKTLRATSIPEPAPEDLGCPLQIWLSERVDYREPW